MPRHQAGLSSFRSGLFNSVVWAFMTWPQFGPRPKFSLVCVGSRANFLFIPTKVPSYEGPCWYCCCYDNDFVDGGRRHKNELLMVTVVDGRRHRNEFIVTMVSSRKASRIGRDNISLLLLLRILLAAAGPAVSSGCCFIV
jgi:hypothetical protein